MSLEKSTPYRNAWYRDLLEKEAELKQYTDEKVAQAIELPEVTSEDNGDLLAADDGSWTKSDKLKTIMNAGIDEVGKIPMVGVTGEWGLTDYPSSELPEVTSADNGNILQVVNGAWAKALSSSDVVIFHCTGTISDSQNLTLVETLGDIIQAVDDGKLPIILHSNGDAFYLSQIVDRYIFTGIDFVAIDSKSDSRIINLRTDVLTITSSHTLFCLISYGLPYVSGGDNDKIPIVKSGKWSWGLLPTELPAVSASDNGNVLAVVNGVWSKSAPSGGLIFFELGGSDNLTLLDNKTVQDIIDAINTDADVVIKRGSAYFRLFSKPTVNTHEFSFVSFSRYSNRNSVRVNIVYGNDNSPESNTLSEYSDCRCVPYTTARNKLLSINNSGEFTYIDKELPTVSSADNGNVLAVVNGVWAKSAPNLIKSVQFVNGQALSDDDYASIKANTNVRGIYSDASKYIIFELSSCNFAQTEFEFVNYKEGLKATIDTSKVVTIASI